MKISPKVAGNIAANTASIAVGGAVLDTVIKAEEKDKQLTQIQSAAIATESKNNKLEEKLRNTKDTIKKGKIEITEKKEKNKKLSEKNKKLMEDNQRLREWIADLYERKGDE